MIYIVCPQILCNSNSNTMIWYLFYMLFIVIVFGVLLFYYLLKSPKHFQIVFTQPGIGSYVQWRFVPTRYFMPLHERVRACVSMYGLLVGWWPILLLQIICDWKYPEVKEGDRIDKIYSDIKKSDLTMQLKLIKLQFKLY